MRASRKTLIVLSPRWLASNWTAFEMQSTRAFHNDQFHGRFLIFQIERSEIPEMLRDVTVIALDASGESAAFGKLRRTVLAARASRGALQPFNGGLKLSKQHASPNWFGVRSSNFEYQMTIDVEVRFPAPVTFDSVILRAFVPLSVVIPDDSMDTVRVLMIKGGSQISYSHRGIAGLPDAGSRDAVIESVSLQGPKGIRLHDLRIGPLCSSIPGTCIFQLTMALYYADTQVTNEIACALPPLSRLPEVMRGDGLEVPCIPLYCLPAASGIVQPSTVESLLETASQFSRDSLLLSISAITMTMWSSGEYGSVQQFEGWQCEFSSEAENRIYYVATLDPSWIDPAQGRQGHIKPECWLTPSMLASCKVDAPLAYLIALQSGARCPMRKEGEGAEKYKVDGRESTNMRLEAVVVDGRWRPVWLVPLRLNNLMVAITADTGEIWASHGIELEKLKQQIWNR